MDDVSSPLLDNFSIDCPIVPKSLYSESEKISQTLLINRNLMEHKFKLFKLGYPLCVFGKGAFFQPYIPLQQIDVLLSKDTTSFLAGTTNAIFTHHKECHIDAVVNVNVLNLGKHRKY